MEITSWLQAAFSVLDTARLPQIHMLGGVCHSLFEPSTVLVLLDECVEKLELQITFGVGAGALFFGRLALLHRSTRRRALEHDMRVLPYSLHVLYQNDALIVLKHGAAFGGLVEQELSGKWVLIAYTQEIISAD